MPRWLCAVLLGVLCLGCGNATYNCTDGRGTCWEPSASLLEDGTASAKGQCQVVLQTNTSFTVGNFTEGSCSSSNSVGTCTNANNPEDAVALWVFYAPAYTAQTAQAACVSLGGVWAP